MNGYFTQSEIAMMTRIAINSGIKDVNGFIAFAESKQRQFSNVTGGYTPETSIQACANKYAKIR